MAFAFAECGNNGRFRDEGLNDHRFSTLHEAMVRRVVNDYNHRWPHSAPFGVPHAGPWGLPRATSEPAERLGIRQCRRHEKNKGLAVKPTP